MGSTRIAVADVSESRLQFCREKPGVRPTFVSVSKNAAILHNLGDGERPASVIDATGKPRSRSDGFNFADQGGRIVFVGLFRAT